MQSELFYVVSLKHTRKRHRYITFWRPDDRGYAWPLSRAGKYDRECIMRHLGYYNTGYADIAVPCAVVDALTVDPVKGEIDNDAGPVVLNTPANWRALIAHVIVQPKEKPKPEALFFGRNAA